MCKVLIIPAIKKHRMRETQYFVKAMASVMSKSNEHGLGYAAINDKGELFGERWFVNAEAFKPVTPAKSIDYSDKKDLADKNLAQFGKALKWQKVGAWQKKTDPPPRYNKFGTDSMENMAAITLHTRYATCEKSLANVHPFVDAALDTSVIHNGVINNVKDFDLKLSTCDSESILISYLKNEVNKDINNVQGMVDALTGYYACGVFSRDADGNRILDVFKYNNNNLSIAYIFELETYVLASSDSDIKGVCEAIGFSHDGTQDIHDNYITRINPFTGDIVAQVEYTKKYTQSGTNNRGYHDYDEYGAWNGYSGKSARANAVTNINRYKKEKEEVKKKTQSDKHIDAKLAEMWELQPDIREYGSREVEEHQLVVGWDGY